MRTRRSVLVGVGGLIAIAGCSQQSSQPAEESDAEGASGEFTVEQFRVGGENPDEYEAEFISGSNAAEVANEMTPEVSYRISDASGEVETEVRYEYSDATIPEDGPLDETVDGATHEGSGEYTQAPSMSDDLVSEIVENPKNLAVRFQATDTGSNGQASREYELDFADSYVEQIQREAFSEAQLGRSDAEPVEIDAEDGVLSIEYNSGYEIGERGFEDELAGIAGLFGSNVSRTRIPYELELKVNGTNSDVYEVSVSDERQKEYLRGDISQRTMRSEIMHNKILPD